MWWYRYVMGVGTLKKNIQEVAPDAQHQPTLQDLLPQTPKESLEQNSLQWQFIGLRMD